MDESKLLEECVNIALTPLQAILLSKTLTVTNTLIEFLQKNDCMVIAKFEKDKDILAPIAEQTAQILIKSALAVLEEVNEKIWENGKKEIGENIPEEFTEVVGVYSIVLQQIAYQFVDLLNEKGD